MELYYKTEDGKFKPIKSLREGIWRIAEIAQDKQNSVIGGKEFNFIREEELPKAMKIASFYSHRTEISKRIYTYLESLGINEGPKAILDIIEGVIKEGN